ncbi:MAG: hypothetical protein AB8H03_28290 [Saprospiraceae bacterium]
MAFDKEKIEQKAIFNFWFKTEFLQSWLVLVLCLLVIHPYFSGTNINPLEISLFGYFMILFLLFLFVLPALFHAFITTQKHTIKSKNNSFKKNINKSLSVISIYIIVGYFSLTRQVNTFSSTLIDHEADLLGRKFRFGASYHDGRDLFYTIIIASLFYVSISAWYLYRIQKSEN